ncbi:MAG: thioesterase family protein [Pseudomonadota bacterium]
MNLVLRLIAVMMTAFRAEKFGIWATSELDVSVWSTDVDRDGRLKQERLHSYADLGTLDYLVRSGILRALRANSWSPIVISKEFRALTDIRRGEKLLFKTRLIGWREHYSCLHFDVLRDGERVAEGHLIGRFVAMPGNPHPTVQRVAVETGFPNDKPPALSGRIHSIMDRVDDFRSRTKKPRVLEEVSL